MHTDRFTTTFIIILQLHPCCNPLNQNLCISIHITLPSWVLTCYGMLDSSCDDLLDPTDKQGVRGVGTHKSHRVIGGLGERDSGRTNNSTSIAKLERNASCILNSQCACACIGPRWNGDHHPQSWGGSPTLSSLSWICIGGDRLQPLLCARHAPSWHDHGVVCRIVYSALAGKKITFHML